MRGRSDPSEPYLEGVTGPLRVIKGAIAFNDLLILSFLAKPSQNC